MNQFTAISHLSHIDDPSASVAVQSASVAEPSVASEAVQSASIAQSSVTVAEPSASVAVHSDSVAEPLPDLPEEEKKEEARVPFTEEQRNHPEFSKVFRRYFHPDPMK